MSIFRHIKQYCTFHAFEKLYIDVMHNHNITVVRPRGVHLIPQCSIFNAECSIVKNKYGDSVLIKRVVTGTTHQS